MCVYQYEVSDDKRLDEQRNTIKVAVLEGDPFIKHLVAISCYDTKPVYFLSTVIEDSKWIAKTQELSSKKWKKKLIHFFMIYFFNAYNYYTNSVE